MENWNDKMKRFLSVAKPCPFCNSTKLDISDKSKGHICVYCRSCLTYGPRVLEYCVQDYKNSWKNIHYFKTLKDKKNNSDGNKYHPSYVKKDDSEVNHDWYYEESVRRWNKRVDINVKENNCYNCGYRSSVSFGGDYGCDDPFLFNNPCINFRFNFFYSHKH